MQIKMRRIYRGKLKYDLEQIKGSCVISTSIFAGRYAQDEQAILILADEVKDTIKMHWGLKVSV
jgi:hypothetical protein